MKIEIHDVGHGGCALVTCPNGAGIMLDCGLRTDPAWFPSVSCMGEYINLLVLQNLDEDHVEDLPYVWDKVRLGAIYSNPTVTAAALAAMKREQGMNEGVRHVHAILNRFRPGLIGARPNLGDVRAWAYTNRYGIDFNDTNNLSVATFIGWGSFTILFAGDLETKGWQALLRIPDFVADLATVTVLVASHHGRANGCCDEVFKIVRPEIVIFSDDTKQYETQETDGWYRQRVRGIPDFDSTPDPIFGFKKRHVLTTRRDGTMIIQVSSSGGYMVTRARREPAGPSIGLLDWLDRSAASKRSPDGAEAKSGLPLCGALPVLHDFRGP